MKNGTQMTRMWRINADKNLCNLRFLRNLRSTLNFGDNLMHLRTFSFACLFLLCVLLNACGGGSSATIRMKNMRYMAPEVQAQAGESVTLRVFNEDGYAHAFDMDDLDIHVQLAANERREFVIPVLAPGRYPFYCSTPGHQMAGMEGVLVVEP